MKRTKPWERPFTVCCSTSTLIKQTGKVLCSCWTKLLETCLTEDTGCELNNNTMGTGGKIWKGLEKLTERQKLFLMSSVFYQTPAETQNTGKSTTGGECTDGHAEVTRWRRAVLFVYVAPGGTVCWQYNPTAHLLPEIHHLSVGNTSVLAPLHHYIITQTWYISRVMQIDNVGICHIRKF